MPHLNIPYGEHPRQVLDIYPCPKPGPRPFYLCFHGGGFRNGDKTSIFFQNFAQLTNQAGITFVAANYRFLSEPEYLAPMIDAARALQFIRHHAEKWNIDPKRGSSGGGSAGAVQALWLALNPDRAKPHDPDPVARESTKLSALACWEPQTTLSPWGIKSIIPGPTWTCPNIGPLVQLPIQEWESPLGRERFKQFDFFPLVNSDSPPAYFFNLSPDLPLTENLTMVEGLHHPEFSRAYKRVMDKVNVTCVARRAEDVPQITDHEKLYKLFSKEAADFLAEQLKA